MSKANPRPAIDRAAPDAEIRPTADAGRVAGPGDVPMPTVENDPMSTFRPGSGLGSADVFEIVLMYLLHLTNSAITVEPGTLRNVPLPAERVAQLSDSARRFMQPLPAPQPAPSIN